MTDNRGDWSWGPDQPAPPTGGFAVALLALVIAVLLGGGAAGVAVHHGATSAATPAGWQRLLDPGDHLSLAVPGRWRAPSLTSGTLSTDIENLKAADPQLGPLADIALAALKKVQLGVFAIDVTTRTSLYAYGTDPGGIKGLDQLPPEQIVNQLTAVGARNIDTRRVHLRPGEAEQLTAQLPIGSVTVSEVVDYLVLGHRLVVVILGAPGDQPPTSLMHQIEATMARAQPKGT